MADGTGVVVGDDGVGRCPWGATEPLRTYHDTEWGVEVRGERGVFERLSLEAFQAGLSWLTILNKRPAFRRAFHDFDPDAVAAFDESDVRRLLDDADIVRSRAKIEATIGNARATLALRADSDDDVGDLDTLVWSFRPDERPAPATTAEVPTTSPRSAALASALKARGFRFVGPTTMHALMEAIGMVDTHLLDCHRRGIGPA